MMQSVRDFAVVSGMVALLTICLAGCDSASLEAPDLGEVIYRLPDVPGAERPYPFPQFGDDQPLQPGCSQKRGR
ncbi:MAG: hypothetical protein ACC645_21745 [Pirellulales bacterium]